ncbi:Adenylate cyclase [Acidisarcina polymorpha]|uniref:Adenylate cyclase n=1 Tax=Acidisarcina polymorpha TaxID=2211140 RepID=A0A2Z5G7Z2_9BACT|nr:protein kinase [Acidisarcina polymorpha]AXC14814.1 Adenylate cyclase [Acidisarcina polymorpha]
MIGRTLSHYRVTAKLGAGAMGEVYRAHDERLERDVALKVLPSGTLSNQDTRRRFRQEAIMLSRLNHPNIAQIYDFDNEEGIDFLVMELVRGVTLAAKMAYGVLSEKEIIRFGCQTAEALQDAHERGVVHRDLKPSNVALTAKGDVKILDFGVAQLLHLEDERHTGNHTDPSAAATMETVALETGISGTLPYMSPEQYLGQRVDDRTDTWALGILLYEMATGYLPFPDRAAMALAEKIVSTEPVPPTKLNPQLKPEIEQVILKCLQKNPDDRFLSTGGVADALRRLQTGSFFGLYVPGESKRLAVLPLENLSGDTDQDYFVDGMHEEVLATLARIGSLTVISRTSVRRYKESQKSLSEIAKELGVDTIVEGSVRQIKNLVRVNVSLVDVAADRCVWTESYQREIEDVLSLQNEVARSIAREIQVKLTPQEEEELSKIRIVKPEAYNAYLKGRHQWNKVTEESIRKSLEYFEQALELDPEYAPAHSGVADCYIVLADSAIGTQPPAHAMVRARGAAARALELDSGFAEAHASLALLSWRLLWDWEAAEKEFIEALRINPNYATAHQWYGWYLGARGRMGEAVREIQHARKLDPLSLWINSSLGLAYYFSRRFDDAIHQLKETLEMDNKFLVARLPLAWSYLEKGMHDEALAHLEQGTEMSRRNPAYVAALAHAYAIAGRRDDAMNALDELLSVAATRYVPSDQIARVYVGLGDLDKAFELLRRAADEPSSYLAYLKLDPKSDRLRNDARFDELLRKINFPQ